MVQRPKILVVGAGLSGSMASLRAIEGGVEVLLLSATEPRRSRSACAKDGINAATDAHATDTLETGGRLAKADLVEAMCNAGPRIVSLFDRMGVAFNRTSEGAIVLKKLEGSSKRRTAFAGDFTGRRIMLALDGQLRRAIANDRLKLLSGWALLSLIMDDSGVCLGVVALDLKNMKMQVHSADAVVLCTGSFTTLICPEGRFPYNDGSAVTAAFEQGACFANPEFVQTEPVKYTAGGLWIDDRHATNIQGLFAAGGCACAYHGAALLPGNDLLASAYGGMAAGEGVARYTLESKSLKGVPDSLLESALAREEDVKVRIASQEGNENMYLIDKELSSLLGECLAAEKDNKVLKKAREKIEDLASRFGRTPLLDRSEWANQSFPYMRRLMRRFVLARLVVDASIARNESRGCHRKPEFPSRDDKQWKVVTKATLKDGEIRLDHSEGVET